MPRLADRPDTALVIRLAAFYRARGFNPLPSRPHDGGRSYPPCAYAQWWTAPAPADLFARYPSPSVQLMTGRFWGLMVLDLDGPEAIAWFQSLGRPVPRTWVTHSGGGGWHVWFRIPKDYPRPLPKAVLWRGEGKHSAVERLCDGSLLMVPPSVHHRTGKRYKFLDAAHSPKRLPMPAYAPAWLLALPAVRPLAKELPPVAAPPPPRRPTAVPGASYRARDVLDAIPDKIGLATGWGLRMARGASGGWHYCFAIDREECDPSAQIHERSGFYLDFGSGARLRFFDLAAAIGGYGDWREAVADLGERYCSRRARTHSAGGGPCA